jgi:hypothetical protein
MGSPALILGADGSMGRWSPETITMGVAPCDIIAA